MIIKRGEIVADDKAGNLQFNNTVQTVYVEFDGKVSKNQLNKIIGVSKVESVGEGWLIESKEDIDLRKTIAQFANDQKLLTLTLRKDEKTLEEVFKELTK